MKNEIAVPLPRQEDLIAANKRREKYALTRDAQALAFNEAIAKRLDSKVSDQVKCEKCGKEFAAGDTSGESFVCSDCS
jgi:formylmethanofuran dehydrogenase subunit E